MTVSSMIARWAVPVSIQTKNADTVDATGSRVETWTTTLTHGFAQVRASTDGVAGGAERQTGTAVVYFPGQKAVAVRDRLVVNGRTFEVTGVRVPDFRASGDAMSYTICDATEVFG